MNFSDLTQPVIGERQKDAREPYVAPALRRLTPEAAKELLLQQFDLSDPDVQHMLRRIEDLQNANSSQGAQ